MEAGVVMLDAVLSAMSEPMRRVARSIGLTGETWPLVWWLARRGAMSGSELGEYTCRHRQDVQRSLEWLRTRGLVVRERYGRVVRWSLTEEAKPVVDRLRLYDAFFEDLFRLEFRDEWTRMLELLVRARDLMRTGRPSAHAVGVGPVPPPVACSFLWDP